MNDADLIKIFYKENNTISSNDLNSLIRTFCLQGMEYPFLARIKSNKFVNKLLLKLDKRFNDYLGYLKVAAELFSKNNVKFMFVKSNPPFKGFSNDFDLLIPNKVMYDKSISLLKDINYSITHKINHEIHCFFDGLTLDVHNKLGWDGFGNGGGGFRLLDERLIFSNSKLINFFGIKLRVPKVEDEILILMAHSLFQHHYLSLYEFFYISELIKRNNIDLDYIKINSSRFGWWQGAKHVLSLVNSKYYSINNNYLLPKSFSIKNYSVKILDYNSSSFTLKLYFNKLINDFNLKSFYYSITGFLIYLMRFLRYKSNGYLAFNIDFLTKEGYL